jgi:Leucine-rich repeat (LRR) protein
MKTRLLLLLLLAISCRHKDRTADKPNYNQDPGAIDCSYADRNLEATVKWIMDSSKMKSCEEAERYFFSVDTLHLDGIGLTSIDYFVAPERITFLDLTGNRLHDLKSLEKFKNLKFLALNGNDISDVSELRGLENLEFLSLAENNISSVAGLGNLPRLIELILYGNAISDLSPLRNELPNLKSLSAFGNPIHDKANRTSVNCPIEAGVSVGLRNYCNL